MNDCFGLRRRCLVALTLAALLVCVSALAQETAQYKGRSLVDALRTLQAAGLRIVFTSATVTPGMRVSSEPRARDARRQLDELLAPHGLKARDGPGGIVEVVRARPAGRAAGSVAAARGGANAGPAVVPSAPAPATHREYVIVTGAAPARTDRGVASETGLDRGQLGQFLGSLADDPVRLVQAFPRVTPMDEFRSEFVVRGSPFRHVDFVVDGVPAQWLQHTAHDRGATGSIAMLSALALEDATLRAGAYPRRYGQRLGPQLDLTIREGSRTGFALRGGVSGAHAVLLGEGPLGSVARGSWLVALRRSYLEWPTERPGSTRTPFGYFDGLAKAVYDLRDTQRIAVSVIGGTSRVDEEDFLAPSGLAAGRSRAWAFNASWRSRLGASVLRQQAFVVRRAFANEHPDGRPSDRGADEEIVYRADVTRPLAGGLLETGAQLGRTGVDDGARLGEVHAVAGSAWTRSAYAHFAWAATPTLTLSPGARVTSVSHLPDRATTSWLLGEWAFRPRWTITASVGASQQLPDLRLTLGETAAHDPRPERARHVDVAIEQQFTTTVRWQATVFSRTEDDILREPDRHPRLVDGAIVSPERRYANALAGSARGIELMVDRRSPRGLSGWAAYSHGRARYTDTDRRETFDGDFDQRHAVTLFGTYRFSDRSSVGGTFRTASNFPIPGYLARRDDGVFVGADRNRLRLPVYARLDLRADRTVEAFGRRATLFVELLNALNRANAGLAGGSVDAATGAAAGLTDRLFRRRVSAGALVEF